MRSSFKLSSAFAAMLMLSLAGCGGGNGNGAPNPPPPPPAPSALSYPAAPAMTRGTAMAALTPSVTGTVTGYTVSPALPAGLTINATSGVISGTPTAITATANYQVTATNGSGSTNATVALTVNDTAPSIDYPLPQYTLSTGASASLTPTSTGGAVVTWSVNPALPAGLAISAATGVISGTPTAAAAGASFVVTATNTGGSDTFNLSITVENATLLDLGHVAGVSAAHHNGQSVLSVDGTKHAVLWNAQTGAILATRANVEHNNGQPCWTSCYTLIALQGNTAVLQTVTTLIVLDATSGAEVSTIPFHVPGHPAGNFRWWRLASDGSYIVTASDVELKVWSRAGALLITKTANYQSAKGFAAPGELRIGGGPAGANVVERIAIPSGASTLSTTHQGLFHSWFDDGEKFLTNVGTTLWVYSRDVAQLDFLALSSLDGLTGQRDWFWTFDDSPGSVTVYEVGGGATPAATFTVRNFSQVYPSNGLIATETTSGSLSVIDLTGAAPVRTDYAVPGGVFAAATPADWAVAGLFGTLVGEPAAPTRIYSYGRVQNIAADANTIAVATAVGQILQFNAQTRALTRQIPFAADKLKLSADGTQLVASPLTNIVDDGNLRIYSTQTGNVLQEWPYPAGGPLTADFDVASAADVLGQTLIVPPGPATHPPPLERVVTTLSNNPLWSAVIAGDIRMYLSPDGTMSAIPVEPGASSPFPTSAPTTNLYTNATLSGALPGRVVGWLDNSRLVVNRMRGGLSHGDYVLDRVEIMSPTGVVQATPALTEEPRDIQPLAGNSFYAPNLNAIFDAATGATLWSSSAAAPDTGARLGAVSGSHIVFNSGTQVRIEPR